MIVKFKIDEDIFNKLKEAIKDKSNKANNFLAGNMKEEYYLMEHIPLLENYLIKQIRQSPDLMNHFKSGGYTYNTTNKPLSLDSLWVNYQKKHEFNPVHNHSGVFSFILFMQVPYYSKGQRELSPGKDSNQDTAGKLQFLTFNSLGHLDLTTLDVDKTWEGFGLLFPAKLGHCVYPFYGVDDYRITISGNYLFKV